MSVTIHKNDSKETIRATIRKVADQKEKKAYLSINTSEKYHLKLTGWLTKKK